MIHWQTTPELLVPAIQMANEPKPEKEYCDNWVHEGVCFLNEATSTSILYLWMRILREDWVLTMVCPGGRNFRQVEAWCRSQQPSKSLISCDRVLPLGVKSSAKSTRQNDCCSAPVSSETPEVLCTYSTSNYTARNQVTLQQVSHQTRATLTSL